MKNLLALVVFILTFQSSFGQACGIYHVKYNGSIKSISYEIEKITFPTIQFLHGLEDKNSPMGTTQVESTKQRFDILLTSHLTSHLYNNSHDLLNFYKEKADHFPIIIILNVNGILEEVQLNVKWKDIEIEKDSKSENVFILNLKKLFIK
jgi:hypothetical protein